jgi:hypothetical protein
MTWQNNLLAAAVVMATSASAWAEESRDAEGWTCASEDMEKALASAERRLVIVEGRLDGALGFAFHSRRHVLTTFGAVFWAEGVGVKLPSGESVEARVVAVAPEDDLAILELPRPLLPEPFEEGEAARVGDPVYAVGTTDYFEGTPTVHAGVVNAAKERRFHTDALEGSFFKVGGPILACKGGLVGIARQSYGDESVPIARARALVAEIGAQEPYEGPPVRPHVELGLIAHGGKDIAGGGASVGFSLVGREGWEVKTRFGALIVGELDGEYHGGRIIAQTALGYRARLGGDWSLSAAGGVGFVFDNMCRDQCAEAEPQYTRYRFMPTLELGVQFWPGTLSYQYQLDVEDPRLSIHQVLVGVDF